MQEVFVIQALRTAQGSFGGALAEVPAPQLAATVIRALLERGGLAPAAVDEVIVGQVLSGGSGQAPARRRSALRSPAAGPAGGLCQQQPAPRPVYRGTRGGD